MRLEPRLKCELLRTPRIMVVCHPGHLRDVKRQCDVDRGYPRLAFLVILDESGPYVEAPERVARWTLRRLQSILRLRLGHGDLCQRRRKFAALCRSKSAALIQAIRPPIGGLIACRVLVLRDAVRWRFGLGAA